MITHLFWTSFFFLRLDMWSAKIYLRKEVPIEDKPLDCPMLIKQWGEWIFKHWTVFKTLIGWWLVWGLWLLYYPLDFRRWWIQQNVSVIFYFFIYVYTEVDKSSIASIPIFGHFHFCFFFIDSASWETWHERLDASVFGLNIFPEKWNIFDKSTRKVLLSLFKEKTQWILPLQTIFSVVFGD